MDAQRELLWRQPWPPRWPDITDRAVLAAIAAVPRHLFVPPQYAAEAYDDIPLPIGQGQTISQPYIVALMTQALRLRATSRVLEVGTGSGYQAAVLAQITPHVYSVEVRPELAEAACERLGRLGYPVQVRVGNGCRGWPEAGPYDGIVVTAATAEVPPALVDQLADRGRLVIPVGHSQFDQELWLVKKAGGRLQSRCLADVRFVPLVGASAAQGAVDAGLLSLRERLRRLLRRW